MLRAVAKCNTIVNNRLSFVEKSLSKTTLKISKCPLEEIGKNSVKPKTTPKIIDSNLLIHLFF